MRAIVVGSVGILLGFAAVVAASSAAPDACEPARCAAQAAIAQDCPCDAAATHGRHVSCVAHVVKRLVAAGTVPVNCKGKVVRCAAKSTCGKPGFVTCYIPTDTCNLTTGTCTSNPALPCLVDADCGTRCKTKSAPEICVQAGGAVGAPGSCCASCATP